MPPSISRVSLVIGSTLALASCADGQGPPAQESALPVEGKVVSRTFASVQPGRIRAEPGLSAFDRAISPRQERSALPVPTFEYRVEIGPSLFLVSTSESDAFAVGTCVRVLQYPSGKVGRVVAATPCRP
jgi:hypothetical protein